MISVKYFSFILIVFLFCGLVGGRTPLSRAQTNLEFFFGASRPDQDVLVEKVLSVDKLRLENGKIVKLIGIRPNAYRRKREKKERDPYGFVMEGEVDTEIPFEQTALDFVVDLVEGKKVRLEFDREKKDEEYASLAYVFLSENNLFVNVEIIKEGYAELRLDGVNTKYNDQLLAAYNSAQKEKKGLSGR